MMIPLKSDITTVGRLMAGSRALWRANGMRSEHFGKPIIGIANSFTQLVPGHVHLHAIGQRVKARIEEHGCFAAEFNTMAIDDGIAMGHTGMLYSLPSRELIADTVESMVNAHCLDAIICISNCDKITPGMLMASMRLNIPTIFVSGGPMEAGIGNIDLVTVMGVAANKAIAEGMLDQMEKTACPTCGSCSGLFTANSMNCLNEALGLALPGNGTILATHTDRLALFDRAADTVVAMAFKYYRDGDLSVLPRSIATLAAFRNAMALDVAMGGSTNTVLHILAIAREAGVDFTMKDIDAISRSTPVLCKVAPSSSYHVQDVNRAGGIMGILAELSRGGLIDCSVVGHVGAHVPTQLFQGKDLGDIIEDYDVMTKKPAPQIFFGAPGRRQSITMGSQRRKYPSLDQDREKGCIRDIEHAYSKDGGLAVLYGNLAPDGCIVKTAGVDSSILTGQGTAIIFDSQEAAVAAILDGTVKPGHAVIIRWEGPKGGPGMQEMLYPTTYLKARGLDKSCFLVTDGRFSGGTCGPSFGHVSPEAAAGGLIGLLQNGDIISYDIPNRTISAQLMTDEITRRKAALSGNGKPNRTREVSASLRRYAHFVTSASQGAVQVIP